MIDAIAWKYRTGSPWMDMPAEFGSWKGAHNRLRKWAADGTWEKVFTTLLAQADAEGDLDWVVAVDSTIVRAHQHAAGARQKGLRLVSRTTMPSDAPVADWPSRSTLPLTAAAVRWPSSSPRVRPATHPHSYRSWTAFGFHDRSADPGRHPTWSSRTRRTRPERSASACDGGESGR